MKYFNEITKQVKDINKKLLQDSILKIENDDKLSFEEQTAVRNELLNLAERFEKNCNIKAELLMNINFEKIKENLNSFKTE